MVSANYLSASNSRQISIGYLIEIEGVSTKFSNGAVINGGTHEKNIAAMDWNPTKLSLDTANVTVGTLKVTLIDPSNTLISAFQNGGTLHRKLVTFKRGYLDQDYSDWNTLSLFRIVEVSTKDNKRIVLKCKDIMDDVKQPVTVEKCLLDLDVDETATTIYADDTSLFPSSGEILVEGERITYSGKTATSFTGLTRSATEANDHNKGSDIYRIHTIEEHPVDMLAQLLISPGGGVSGSLYDVLDIGLGLDETDFDLTTFTDIKNNSSLSGDTWRYEIAEDIPNLLKWAINDIFNIANIRLYVNDEGKYALALLNEVTLDQFAGDLIKEDVIGDPRPLSNSDRIVNQVRFKMDYNLETNKYEKEVVFNDESSQAIFGVRPGKLISSKGLRAGLDGAGLAQVFANKYFRRVGEPYGLIKDIKCLWKKQFFKPGDKVYFTHDRVMNFTEGKFGINNQLVEIVSPDYNFDKGEIKYVINNSPSMSSNFGFIAPSSKVASGTHSTTVFDVETGEVARAEWEAGQEIALWLREGGSAPIATATIESVSSDEITLVSPGFGGTVPNTTHQIMYADYENVTDDQKKYAFISDGANDFSDGREVYKVS